MCHVDGPKKRRKNEKNQEWRVLDQGIWRPKVYEAKRRVRDGEIEMDTFADIRRDRPADTLVAECLYLTL